MLKTTINQIAWSVVLLGGALLPAHASLPVPPLKYPKPLPMEQVRRFSHALEAVRTLYVDEVDDKELLENAIQGMLTGLDPHSDYLSAKDFESLDISTKGEFSGLGIEVTMEHGVVRVISPIDDTPAFNAGIKAGDLIVRIDGKPIKGMSLSEAVNKMRGKRDSEVTLTVIRKGLNAPMQMTIVRDVIEIKSVKSRLIDDVYAYVRVSSFQINTHEALKEAIDELIDESGDKLQGLVLDLRNNPGGVLQTSVEVADLFLDSAGLDFDKKIVYTKGRLPQVHFTGVASTPDHIKGLPMVVLINMGSASASEIVAGALQDHQRAVIMGTQSFGKGSVQTVLPLEGGDTAIKITTARYYTPAGKAIQSEGVTPDVIVDELTIPDTVKAKEDFFIRESALNGALEQVEDKRAAKRRQAEAEEDEIEEIDEEAIPSEDVELMDELLDETDETDSKDLLYQDYQLHEAINLLKGLNIMRHEHYNRAQTV